MRKLIFIFFTSVVLSCSGPQNYVRKAIVIMDKNGLYAEGESWDSTKTAALKSTPQTMEDAYAIVREALKVAGGKHSFLSGADKVANDLVREWEMPRVMEVCNKIVTISLPEFHGNKNEGQRYANTVIEAVPEDVAGVIVDLRGNVGGDMYPMIAAVHRFIPDGNDMLRFKSRKKTTWIPLSYVLSCSGVAQRSYIDCPVAILIDSLTASSGEATLLCFRGLKNVLTFGCPTAGYASSNMPFQMPDGSSLVLTTGCDVARTGEEFCDDPIAPDFASIDPATDALIWLQSQIK